MLGLDGFGNYGGVMSVAICRLEYHYDLPFSGRTVARWLVNHLDGEGEGESTRVFVRAESLEEQLAAAKDCIGCEGFHDASGEFAEGAEPTDATMEEHHRITKMMSKVLPQLIKDQQARAKAAGEKIWELNDWADLEIHW